MSAALHHLRAFKAALSGAMMLATVGVSPTQATDMTAGVVVKEMDVKEFYLYVAGIVEGLAYARFRKDSAAAGHKDERAMKCIYDWFYEGDDSIQDKIESAFRKYADYSPSVVMTALIKQECGE